MHEGRGYGLPVRARSERGLARLSLVMLLGAGSLLGCHDPGAASNEPDAVGASEGSELAWVAGEQGEAGEGEGAEPEDDGSHDLLCQQDPEAPGCPWDRNATNFVDEGVWGNHDPSTMPLPEPAGPERCPDDAVLGEMIEIPAGEFVMGCDIRNSQLCGQNERKLTTVELPAFAIDRTEVTQAAYERCIEAGVCEAPAAGFSPGEDCTHPVVNVSWQQAGQYCAWLDKRLPTEAEWEKAARGDDGRLFPWGDEAPTCELANFEGCGLRAPQPVASHPAGASPYGLMDMAGNVREWVFDREEGRKRQPKRGIRGGMFTDQATHIRAVRRTWGDVNVSDIGIGFRCAK
ncbi:SUMF1/EgtB/PvdO family nonheme iron enzyme [Pseudenhygromyxa sp. WMMC2535]|uniref:formylglycine-generating enzyme family protein n=1 Tax=Pseudenhygromyxa sp. WMMC2535 TaxID=2712867 RepID=UPI0015958BD3|nr:SUMF1/EgtB/PvdO family nonheme iron enzyme [Pseudenhygromyxa sp. WMMC2535]NVB42440.1 SUMF1/EgtB/PvdO family nonheme iron enzyme [Pseudenhygromyxa sp. WMMC2535]